MWKRVLPILAVAVLALPGIALAWPGGPPAKVVVSGPGLAGEVEVTDPVLLEGLGAEQFIAYDAGTLDAPRLAGGQTLGTSYVITRYYKESGNALRALDRVRYFPNAAGGHGYVLYEAGLGYSPAHNAGHWFYATPQGDAAMQRLLAALGAGVPRGQAYGACRPGLLFR